MHRNAWKKYTVRDGAKGAPRCGSGKLQISKRRASALTILDLRFLGGWCGELTGWRECTDLYTGNETVHLRLGLEPTGQDSNPDKTQYGTSIHSLLIRITHLVSGLTDAQVLSVSPQKEFSKRQSDRQEVDFLI